MSLSDKIKDFNEIFNSLLIQISPHIGSSYHIQFEQIIKYNSLLPIEQFLVYALPRKDKILSRNEEYFTNISNKPSLEQFCDNMIKNKEQIIDKKVNNDNCKHSKAMNEIIRLKDIYINLDDTSKSNIWDIFQALLIIGEEYVKIKYS